jgi:hypothetical protein
LHVSTFQFDTVTKNMEHLKKSEWFTILSFEQTWMPWLWNVTAIFSPRFPKQYCFLEYSQALSVCSGKSRNDTKKI